MPLEQFIETYIERRGEGAAEAAASAASGPTAYLAQHRLFEQVTTCCVVLCAHT